MNYDDALKLATKMHKGQLRKNSNKNYIVHPIAVADKFKDVNYKIVAVLHDTIEDTELTLKDLKDKGLSDELIFVIDILTHNKKDKTYLGYLLEIQPIPMARKIKTEDINHNLSDLNDGCLKDKYLMALHILNE